MKQTNLLSLVNPKKNFANSANRKSNPVKIITSYKDLLQESIANVSRPVSRNNNTSRQIVQENNSSKDSLSKSNPVVYGDANDDGLVDEKDTALVLDRMFADMTGTGHTVKVNMKNVDFGGDGKITLEDYSTVLSIYNERQKQAKQVLKGDANGDGKVNQRDLELISSRMINASLDKNFDIKAADMNGDGEIDSIDVSKVRQLVKEHEASVRTLQGDSNGDGVVNETDHQNIKDYLSGKGSSEDFIKKN